MDYKTVIFLIHEVGDFETNLQRAKLIETKLRCKILFFFSETHYRRLSDHTKILEAHNMSWLDHLGCLHDTASSAPNLIDVMPTSILKKEEASLRRNILFLPRVLKRVIQYKKIYQRTRQIILRYAPDMVITNSDYFGSPVSFFLALSVKYNIKTFIFVEAMPESSTIIKACYHKRDLDVDFNIINKLVSVVLPRWRYRRQGKSFLRTDADKVVAFAILKIYVHNIWYSPGAMAKNISCKSAKDKEVLLKHHIPKESISIIGSPTYQRMNAIGQDDINKFKQSLNLKPNSLTITCSWPTDMTPWLSQTTISYKNYDAICYYWAHLLDGIRSQYGCNIIVSVHPKTDDKELKYLYDLGLLCYRDDSLMAILASDLFISHNCTSVTSWALVKAIPSLLYDCNETGYTCYEDAKACHIFQDSNAFEKAIGHYCTDHDALTMLTKTAQEDAANWGVIDDQYEKRFLNFLCANNGAINE